MLHALMSASRIGYRRCAIHFNELGRNACFVHLPYHFSRVPRGYWNGELAITCDLIRNAEGLRQGVIELRQLIRALRQRGCRDFSVLATSYGGWIGALLAMVERDLRFVALMAPIVDIEHAIWASPAARLIRRELFRANIEPSLVARHFHLSSPLHNQPLCDAARVLFRGGGEGLHPVDLPLYRGRREFDFHLFHTSGSAGMAGSGRRYHTVPGSGADDRINASYRSRRYDNSMTASDLEAILRRGWDAAPVARSSVGRGRSGPTTCHSRGPTSAT